jgi:hypothetical protein
MGFAATREFFYSSGHPARGSGLVNPFGLLRSRDGGKTWEKLGLEGEADFHLLATSHGTNAVYVYSDHPNSKMPTRGIYATVNQVFTWRRAEAKGPGGEPNALAVHPAAGREECAIATFPRDVYLTKDRGKTWKPIAIRGKPL